MRPVLILSGLVSPSGGALVLRFEFVGPGVFFGVGEGVAVFGLLLLGLVPAGGVSGFSLGRQVKNAPRTSSCSCWAMGNAAMTTAKIHIDGKRKILSLIQISLDQIPAPELLMLNTNVKDNRITRLVWQHFETNKWARTVRFIQLGRWGFCFITCDKILEFGLLC